ncbi:MAG: signal peptide peptidase SppA [Rickettsiaceae bacterium H1]|nr:signal peptide peptidase SppA [Rickettsiaceae bacterium H1]
MSLSVDKFISTLHLKKAIFRWRFISLLLFLVVLLLLPRINTDSLGFIGSNNSIIARIYVTGFIDENHERDRLINKIKEDKNVKGVIVHINSPGGSLVGGETLYNSLRELSAKKHVVAVMGNVAASGGYIAAIAADHLIAHNGTITGSIGVLFQSFEVSELANKIGVNIKSLKAGEFKDSLSPFSKMSEKSQELFQGLLDSSYDYFVSLVAKRRSISIEEVKSKAEGKVYTGKQALLISLIDQIGGEPEAINWLKSNNVEGKIKDFSIKESRFSLGKLIGIPQKSSFGLLALWTGY